MAYHHPGVYVEETSLFPPSVAEVATAIPAFIGYTAKAIKKGEDLTNKPTRITSLLDYRESFGGDFEPNIKGKVDPEKKTVVEVKVVRFYMYESLRLFFDNGGGHCYIVSVGDYKTAPDQDGLKKGLDALEKYDEPTIIVIPDAVALETGKLHALQRIALAQCGKLKDRIAILDLPNGNGNGDQVIEDFREAIGINNVKYGAAYTPWLVTAYEKDVPFMSIRGLENFDALVPGDEKKKKEYDDLISKINQAVPVKPGQEAAEDVKIVSQKIKDLSAPEGTLAEHFTVLTGALNAATGEDDGKAKLKSVIEFLRTVAIGVVDWRAILKGHELLKKLDALAEAILKPAVDGLVAMEKNTEVEALLAPRTDKHVNDDYGQYDELVGKWISKNPKEITEYTKHYANDAKGDSIPKKEQAIEIGEDLEILFSGLRDFVDAVENAAKEEAELSAAAPVAASSEELKRLTNTLYSEYPVIGNIAREIMVKMSEVPPGGAVAGVYALVDSTRGVWKAPANVSLNQVLRPLERIDDATQDNLNVHVMGGKSINAIRAFTGRGTIIWGARTLAGNDNEWRYINVRRFFNMVEESVKKSTAWAVFEPNAAPLWIKVKGMVENYLIQKWREGALAGARPDDAFYVKVGLGQTMTAQDILEGKLNVEIGMAVVRPAEFIVLKFSHLMQRS
ncbi:MAG: phage tail protein [Deltaproteobacteria bacterium HGW-Deltaproteobacteria-15]|jgi:hypothetical protein|nr:MAG: phage tail protein [Deltaproteobacteria bacterium HGW-Deltaproteobacteria-15]